MAFSHAAFCTDHYVNQRLSLKLDLSMRRETVLALFDRLRREHPRLDRMRRLNNELALETPADDVNSLQQWIAIRRTSIRSGVANPSTQAEALGLHRVVLETAPFFVDISALDADHLELLYGFDLEAAGNHDAIVHRALMAGSAISSLLDRPNVVPLECQPMMGVCLGDSPDRQAFLEVKTRTTPRTGRSRAAGDGAWTDQAEAPESPISVYLTVRRLGPFRDVADLPAALEALHAQAMELIDSVVLPNVLTPLRSTISAGH
ncbi:MAG: hypothetical protein KF768_07900 [Phycisphaeraceae bacterium]|nr:hypothetical protein [Phycisphaeraceae bacterium]